MIRNRKAQSTLEYAVLIAVVVGALIAIQIYLKRGVQGKMRESADQIGEQYSAGKITGTVTTSQTGDMITSEDFGTTSLGQGISKYNVTQPASMTRTTNETLTKNLSEEKLVE